MPASLKPFGPSSARPRGNPRRGAVPRRLIASSGLLRPLLTSAARSSSLAEQSVPARAGTRGRSPEVSLTAFDARLPDLRFAPLMDMGFAVSCPLARRSRLRSGSCSSTRVFASPFFQTSPRGDALGVGYPSPPSGWTGTCTRSCQTCSAHNEQSRPGWGRLLDARDRDRTIRDLPEKSSDLAEGAAKSAAIDPILAELLARWDNLPPVIKSAILAVAREHRATG